jgi:hypothetical protein
MSESTPNTVDYTNSGDYPSDPDTLNYNYNTATYNEQRPFESNYKITNYDITNYPKSDYNKFNANLTNYIENNYKTIENPLNTIVCASPDMLYKEPRDLQYVGPTKYVCFNNKNKLVDIIQEGNKWVSNDLSNSDKHIIWQGAQCKINTDVCNKNNLTEDCEATCYVNQNDAFTLKYKNDIWRRPDMEKNAGACTMTAISKETAQDSFCQCDNVLDRPNLMTSPNLDKDRTGKFWCSSN